MPAVNHQETEIWFHFVLVHWTSNKMLHYILKLYACENTQCAYGVFLSVLRYPYFSIEQLSNIGIFEITIRLQMLS